ncbi:hypothetical protein [Acidovorax sp.]|uniref:hypothetical protein n=1 Tax=Acidovorax sp. TaxID=1872122 RepID=UPI0027B9E4C5|nr:hypothetical protein [Acidovorax sp.]
MQTSYEFVAVLFGTAENFKEEERMKNRNGRTYKSARATAGTSQRGYVVWIFLAVLIAALLGAWRYSEHRAAQKQLAKEVAEKQALQMQAEQERKALEERLAKEKAQRDALSASLKAFDDVVGRWEDAMKVASTTGRGALSGPVATLQAVRRDAEQIVAPPCLDIAKRELINSMNSTERGFLVFMRNELKLGDVLAAPEFEDAQKSMAAFKAGRAACPAASS